MKLDQCEVGLTAAKFLLRRVERRLEACLELIHAF